MICLQDIVIQLIAVHSHKLLIPGMYWHLIQNNDLLAYRSCFHRYKNCVAKRDCTESFIERPFNLPVKYNTPFKNTNTIKYLIGITPAGAVSF